MRFPLLVRDPADLTALWRFTRGSSAFTDRVIWALCLDGRGLVAGALLEFGELPDLPGGVDAGPLAGLLGDLLDGPGAERSVALLLGRPGAGPWQLRDRAWARHLDAFARALPGPTWPVHVANRDRLERWPWADGAGGALAPAPGSGAH